MFICLVWVMWISLVVIFLPLVGVLANMVTRPAADESDGEARGGAPGSVRPTHLGQAGPAGDCESRSVEMSTVSRVSSRMDPVDIRRFRVKHALRSLEDALMLLESRPAEGIETAALERVRDDLAVVLRLAEADCR
jgi:hypothetical protein